MNSIKTLFSIVFLVILSQTSFGQKQTLFLDKDFETVMQQAKLEKKPVILMFYASWCVHCNKMKNDIFVNQEVINFYNQNYICVASDIESMEGKSLREKLKNQLTVKSYPTFGYFDYNGNITNAISGEFKTNEFILEGVNNLDEANHLNNIKSAFEKDASNFAACFSYVLITKRTGKNPTKITQEYLKTVAPSNYYTEDNWRLIANGITDFDAPEFLNIIQNRTKFENVVSKTRVEKKINYVIKDNFGDFIATNDTLNYNKNRKLAADFNNTSIDSIMFFQDLSFYERTLNWKAYNTVLEKNMEKYGLNDAQLINSVSANYSFYISDKKMLENAISWQKTAIKLSPTLDKYLLISNLCLKAKNYSQGIQFATQGIEFGESLGFNTTDIKSILAELKAKSKK